MGMKIKGTFYCEECNSVFEKYDKRTTKCNSCKTKTHPCINKDCNKQAKHFNKYCSQKCAHNDPENLIMVEQHKQKSIMMKERNPTRLPEVRKKISDAIKAIGCCWKLNKTDEQIRETAERISRGSMNVRFKKRFPNKKGELFRSRPEVIISNILDEKKISYEYERPLKLKTSVVFPDFSILSDDDSVISVIEFTGSFYRNWRESFIEKVRKIRECYPGLQIVVITYPENVWLLSEIVKKYNVTMLSYGEKQLKKKEVVIKTIAIEDGRFNFDYAHFLPFHKSACRSYHGHSSIVSVAISGYENEEGMIIDFKDAKTIVKDVITLVDHKLLVPVSVVKKSDGDYYDICYKTKVGTHEMRFPKSEVVVLNAHTTVEHVSSLIATEIFDRMPANVTDVIVRMNEGLGKSAESHSVHIDGENKCKIFSGQELDKIIGLSRMLELANKFIEVKCLKPQIVNNVKMLHNYKKSCSGTKVVK